LISASAEYKLEDNQEIKLKQDNNEQNPNENIVSGDNQI
jgi:hypothetical protein